MAETCRNDMKLVIPRCIKIYWKEMCKSNSSYFCTQQRATWKEQFILLQKHNQWAENLSQHFKSQLFTYFFLRHKKSFQIWRRTKKRACSIFFVCLFWKKHSEKLFWVSYEEPQRGCREIAIPSSTWVI